MSALAVMDAAPAAETERDAAAEPAAAVEPFEARIIPEAGVAFLWPAFEGFVEQACAASGGRYAADWVAQAAQAGYVQMWAVLRDKRAAGLVITTLTSYPTGLRALQVALAAGPGALDSAPAVWRALLDFAAEKQAGVVEWTGRRGWLRHTGGREIGVAGEVHVVA